LNRLGAQGFLGIGRDSRRSVCSRWPESSVPSIATVICAPDLQHPQHADSKILLERVRQPGPFCGRNVQACRDQIAMSAQSRRTATFS
jgi:hypothetical protein